MIEEARAYGRIAPTTRLKNAMSDIADMKIAVQHLGGYNGQNLSDGQVATLATAAVSAPAKAVTKLEDLKRRVNEFLRKV